MNSLQRFVATIGFAETDRVPVAVPVFGHAAFLQGISLPQYLQSGALLAQGQLQALRSYSYDTVFAFLDANVEAEALGASLRYRERNYPTIEKFAFSPSTDFSSLTLPDPLRDGRMPQILEAIRILRDSLGDTTPVIGCLLGPFTLATQLLGLENTLLLAVDEPEAFAELLDFATEVCVRYGIAQIEAGAHVALIFDIASTSEIIPAPFFREFEMGCLNKVFRALNAAGALANWLFITGRIDPILPYIAEAGPDIVNFDYPVAPQSVSTALPQTCLNGNVKPLLFEYGQPGQIVDAAHDLLEIFSRRGGYVLTPGCEVPLESRPENIQAFVASVAQGPR